ncbi:hypothetical protein QBC44DRAFT_368982 [Cladorrhinum sp. PSN332]|nr:hypothetical protein QBC44DRAFT_368982 [Cladorrhinum sp. PSN332]
MPGRATLQDFLPSFTALAYVPKDLRLPVRLSEAFHQPTTKMSAIVHSNGQLVTYASLVSGGYTLTSRSLTDVIMWQVGFVVLRKSTDFFTLSHTTIGSGVPEGTSPPGPAPPGRDTSTTTSTGGGFVELPDMKSGGLAMGTVLGIAIGVTAGAMSLTLLAIFHCCWRRRKRARQSSTPGTNHSTVNDKKAKELDGKAIGTRHEMGEPERGIIVTPELEGTSPITSEPGVEGNYGCEGAGADRRASRRATYTYDGLPSWSPTTWPHSPSYPSAPTAADALDSLSQNTSGPREITDEPSTARRGSEDYSIQIYLEQPGENPNTAHIPAVPELRAQSPQFGPAPDPPGEPGSGLDEESELETQLRRLEEEEARIREQKKNLINKKMNRE